MEIQRPNSEEYNSYYEKYISKIKSNVLDLLTSQRDVYTQYIKDNASRLEYRYGKDKWTIRESYIHVIDTEQIFAYRARRIARGDSTPLAGFDQNEFIEKNDFSQRSAQSLAEEFEMSRNSVLSMIKHFREEDLVKIGKASESPVSVRALIYMIAGHAEHHLELFRDKYSQ